MADEREQSLFAYGVHNCIRIRMYGYAPHSQTKRLKSTLAFACELTFVQQIHARLQ